MERQWKQVFVVSLLPEKVRKEGRGVYLRKALVCQCGHRGGRFFGGGGFFEREHLFEKHL